MKALVTGGAGFIGSALAKALVAEGHSVRVLDNLSAGTRDAVPPEAELIEGDLRDVGDVERATAGAEVVFHQAAMKSVPLSIEEPRLFDDCNVGGTLNLLIAAEEGAVRRLVNASSSSVYGGSKGRPSREDDLPSPISPYGVSKLTAEHYCRVWTHLNKLPTVTLRYFNVFGPGQPASSKYAAVFPAFIAALRAGKAPVIYGDGEQSRAFTYIEDVVDANLRAAASGEDTAGAVINAASSDAKTVNEVFATIAQILGADIAPDHRGARVGDIRHSTADGSKARELLGWEPKTDWRTAVEATVDWFNEGVAA